MEFGSLHRIEIASLRLKTPGLESNRLAQHRLQVVRAGDAPLQAEPDTADPNVLAWAVCGMRVFLRLTLRPQARTRGRIAHLFAAPILLVFDDRIASALRFSLKRTRRYGSSVIAANAFAV